MKTDTEENRKSKLEFSKTYEGRTRVRVCGIAINNDAQILMVKHENIGKRKVLWAPPGGGLDFGETVENSLIREFKEETGLDVEVDDFMFVNEVLSDRVHAIEIFFRTRVLGGRLITGKDPETSIQFIRDVQWMDFDRIKKLPEYEKHNIFHGINSIHDIINRPKKSTYRF